jgi:hypothetical protein
VSRIPLRALESTRGKQFGQLFNAKAVTLSAGRYQIRQIRCRKEQPPRGAEERALTTDTRVAGAPRSIPARRWDEHGVELTGKERGYLNALLMGYTRREIDEKLDETIDFADLDRFIE